jgi:hypothetical protein
MSLGLCVHFDKRNMITLETWRAEISKLGYPLVLPDSFDPSSTEGYIDCVYDGEPTSFAIDLNDDSELPSPFPDGVARLTMEFSVNTSYGEAGWFGAVAAAAAFCLATAGVIDEYNGLLIKHRRARAWARSIIRVDDAMTRMAMKHPHPDTEPAERVKGPAKSWWAWWKRQ